MSHFQTRVKNFFAIRENFLPRRPCGHGQFVGANGFMRLFGHTVKHFSAKNFAFLPAAGATFPRMPEGHAGYRHPPLPLSCFSSDNASVPAVPGNKTPRAFPPCGPRPAGLHAARRAKTWHPSPQGRLPAHRHFPPPRTLPAFQPLSGNKKGSPKAPRSCDVRLMLYAA